MIDWQDGGSHGHRRRFARRAVHLPARLQIGGRSIPATTENISPGGAFLRVALPENTRVVIATIALPHGKDLRVRAKVRWRRAAPPGVGVEFDTFLDDLSAPA